MTWNIVTPWESGLGIILIHSNEVFEIKQFLYEQNMIMNYMIYMI